MTIEYIKLFRNKMVFTLRDALYREFSPTQTVSFGVKIYIHSAITKERAATQYYSAKAVFSF